VFLLTSRRVTCWQNAPHKSVRKKRQHSQIPGAQNAVGARGGGHGIGWGVAGRSLLSDSINM